MSRKSSPPSLNGLQYLLLAGLWVQPRSGADLDRWLREAARHYWATDHSSIYPALARLERQGLIRHHVSPGGRGPARKIHRLTSAGRQALRAWAAQPPLEAQVRDEQIVKMLAVELLPRPLALAQLEATRARHAAKLEFCERGLARPAPLPLGLRLTLLRGAHASRGYLAWCDEAMHLLAETPAPGPLPPPA